MLKRKLILGMTPIALALVMAIIAPLASADNNNDQNNNNNNQHDNKNCKDHNDDNQKSKSEDDNNKCKDHSTAWIEQLKKEIIAEIMKQITGTINTGTDTSPTAVYTHLDIGTCAIDPITLVSQGWCPDGIKVRFFIPDSGVTQYSVISVTTIPPVVSPLSTLQCSEETINYNVGPNQGFGIICNYAALKDSGLNYIIFNPSQNWYVTHHIPHP